MLDTLPSHAVGVIGNTEWCTVPCDGYAASSVPHIRTRGRPTLQDPAVEVKAEDSGVWIAEDSSVAIRGRITGRNSAVVIGPRCRIKNLSIHLSGHNALLIIGADTSCEGAAMIVGPDGQFMVIGDDCMISTGVTLRTNDGHAIFDRGSLQRINEAESVTIQSHVWLGNSSRVNKGVTIGCGSVLGQCSIASGVLEPHSIYGGVPCRLIRSGIAWSRTHSYADIPSGFR